MVSRLESVGILPQKMLEYIIMYSGVDETDKGTYNDVAKIVDAKIHPRIAGEECPKAEKGCKLAASH